MKKPIFLAIFIAFLAVSLVVLPSISIGQSAATWIPTGGNLKVFSNNYGIRVPKLQSTGNPCLTVGTTGIFATTTCGGGSSNWTDVGAYLRPNTATDGIRVAASSTIGDGTQTGGLTIYGGATTTLQLNSRGIQSGTKNTIGSSSIAAGFSNSATTSMSGAFGRFNSIRDRFSFALGSYNIVSGQDSLAVGSGNTVEADAAYALGTDNNILGVNDNSFIVGSLNTIESGSGGNNYVFGYGNQVGSQGQYQFVMGNTNNLLNARDEVYAFGFANTVEGFYAGAFGSQNYVMRDGAGNTPDGSNAFGINNYITCGAVCISIGHNNDVLDDLSVAIGSSLRSSSTKTIVIGTGVNNANRLTSLIQGVHFGTNSTIPTMSITAASGAGTYGKVGIATTSPVARLEAWGTSGGTIFNLFTSAKTNVMSVLDTGVTTLLGTWDFTGTVFRLPYAAAPTISTNGDTGIDSTSNQFKYQSGGATRVLGNGNLYPTFTIYATSTSFSGTTTWPIGTAYIAETWNGVQCFTDVGTLKVRLGDGTNWMNTNSASTTAGTTALSSNNTFTATEKRYVQVGTPASSPTKLSCTVSKSITAD